MALTLGSWFCTKSSSVMHCLFFRWETDLEGNDDAKVARVPMMGDEDEPVADGPARDTFDDLDILDSVSG